MRRFLFGVVIASVTAAMPAWAFGGDREIAQSVMAELQQHKAAGNLKGFDIDLKVEDGVVYLSGEVASRAQRAIVEQAALNEVSRANLVNELQVKGDGSAVSPVTREEEVRPAVGTQYSAQPVVSDVAITDAVIAKLQQSKAAGELRGFDLDVSTVNGDVWVQGSVASQAQKNHVLEIARHTVGVSRVIDEVRVARSGPVRQVSTGTPAPLPQVPVRQVVIPQASSMPVAGNRVAVPQAFAPSGLAGYTMNAEYAPGVPVAMHGAGGEYGAGAPRYDQPNMPSYAWPSYAAHPNYAAVTYPKQYSPSAWPYIGPFYPYPQVPLGWRKVALEWDDGLWYLDFTSK